jgi:hypothetical protein
MKKYVLPFLLLYVISLIPTISFAQNSNWIWAKGSNGSGEVLGSATDKFANVYSTGYFEGGSITFGTTTLTISGASDVFLAKYDSSGNAIWAKKPLNTTSYDQGAGVATDKNANIYLAGSFRSPIITFGSYTLTNTNSGGVNNNIFLVKYNPAGNVIWAKSAGGIATDSTMQDMVYGVATDATGKIYITGSYSTPTITLGTYTLTNSSNTKTADIFLAKFDSSGNVLWAKMADGIYDDLGFSVNADNFGNVYLTGRFLSDTLTFGSNALINSNNNGTMPDIFLTKYDSSGNVLWAKSAGNTNWESSNSVATDLSGNIYTAGNFISDTLKFGTYILTNLSGAGNIGNFFLTKWSPSGNIIYSKSGGGTNIGYNGYSCATDIKKNIYVAGSFVGSAPIFDSHSVFFSGGWDPSFIVKYDSLGNFSCASALASGGDDNVTVCVDRACNAYLVGDLFSTPVTIGTTTLVLTGGENPFVAKFRSACGNTDAILELSEVQKTFVFPNPTVKTISFNLENTVDFQNSTITIQNALGQTVKKISFSKNIDVSDLPEGYYFLQITLLSGETYKTKFIKQKFP